MEKPFDLRGKDLVRFTGLVALWLAAYKSADLFNFFETYSSLWFLPAGITMAIAMTAPHRFLFAPLVANLLLAIPAVCSALGIEFTNFRDPILHSFRLFAIYAGAGLVARHLLNIATPISELRDQLKLVVVVAIAAAVGALSGVSMHAAVGNFPWHVAWEILLPWGVGDSIGTLIVLPVLVPLLLKLFGDVRPLALPDWQIVAFQLIAILLAMFIAFWGAPQGPHLGSLAYIILLPPVVFAVTGGLPSAATAITLTALLTPPAATWFGYDGERIGLQFLLLITAISTLMIGGAISDRETAFKAVKDSEEGLEEEVKSQTKDLRDAYEFQQHLMRSIGHDLRQPIHSLNMMLDGLVIEHKDSAAAAPLGHARDISQTATGFIEKVLAYAKREAGKVEVISAEFALQRVFDEVTQSFSAEASERGVKLIVVPTNHQMHSDKDLVWEAVSNLVQNAIRMSTEGQQVVLKTDIDETAMTISVSDEIATKDSEPGQAGFGLEIVKQISSMLGAEFALQPNLAVLRFGSSAA
ncbi:sensor histidine kinase [Shimia ponticola]|uniref:sensor histidine kinase n=1 Tax=Shimia ponticola TaxID=2582893 RepID=UPI00164B8F14|nr:MASE1 domain-containing protein [Shimia ponticola]